MQVVKKLRQTLIDHNPDNGDFQGATRIYEKVLVDENGQVVEQVKGLINEVVPVEDLPALLGEVAGGHVKKLAEVEEILAAEREAAKNQREKLQAQIQELEAINDRENRTNRANEAKFAQIRQIVG